MASYKVAYGERDKIDGAIQNGLIPAGCIILTEDSNEIFFYDLNKVLTPYEEKYKFSSLKEAEDWVSKYGCQGRIISVHEDNICNIYVVNYNGKLSKVSGPNHLLYDRDPTGNDYNYDILTHWINTATEEVFILVSKSLDGGSWKSITAVGSSTSGDLSYRHTQRTSSDTWTINHNLNKYPSVSIVDSSGNVVVGDIRYVDVNTVVLEFKGAFSGKAYLN